MVVISDVQNMFWGVTIEAGKRYSQVVTNGFHLSMAALEPGKGPGEYVQVMVQLGSSCEFLLCSLHQDKLIQQPLDLVFAAGEELSFSLTGKGVVHLTGYLLDNGDEEDFDEDYSDEEEDSDAPELVEIDADQLKAGSKRKAIAAVSDAKRKKLSDVAGEDDESDEDDEDYSEDELTFDEEEDEFDDDEEDEDEEEDEEEEDEAEAPLTPAKKTPVTPKGDNAGSAKKNKKEQSTPLQKGAKTPTQTPSTPATPANGETESAKKKKKKKKKNKDKSMNESASSPEKSSTETTPKPKGKKEGTPKTPKEGTPKSPKEGTPKSPKGDTPKSQKADTPGKRRVVAGGTVVEDIKVGHGPEAKAGKMLSVYYVGTLSKNSKQFDSCTSGKPFRFRLKQSEVIKGWDNGMEGMKVGGKRKITVPANQGYGNQRQGPIPANSALTFEVELKAVS